MRTPLLILLLLLHTLHTVTHASEPLRVAVAANFRHTLEQISERFERRSGYRVLLSSASTGTLYNQILRGAPFHLFFAADRERPQGLAAAGLGHSECYARGRLVLVGGGLEALADPSLSLAIANPETAPYGAAAAEVLARPEFSAGTDRRLVRGQNVAQAFQFWHSGATELALVARALAPAATPVPQGWHRPVDQYLLVLARAAASEAAAAYMDWVRSDTVRSLIIEAGYDPCP